MWLVIKKKKPSWGPLACTVLKYLNIQKGAQRNHISYHKQPKIGTLVEGKKNSVTKMCIYFFYFNFLLYRTFASVELQIPFNSKLSWTHLLAWKYPQEFSKCQQTFYTCTFKGTTNDDKGWNGSWTRFTLCGWEGPSLRILTPVGWLWVDLMI